MKVMLLYALARTRIDSPAESLGEETIDVVVGDLRERRLEIHVQGVLFALHFLRDLFENLLQLRGGSAHPQTYQAERRALIEDDDEDDPLSDDGDMDVVLLPLVKEDRKLFFPDEPGQAVGGRHVARGQGRQRGRVQGVQVADRGDLLPVLVDQEDD